MNLGINIASSGGCSYVDAESAEAGLAWDKLLDNLRLFERDDPGRACRTLV
jgi:hypothetical protein